MLMYPQWPAEATREGCRAARWAPSPRLAPYFARPLPVRPPPPLPLQAESEVSGGSSPERAASAACGWAECGARFAEVSRLSAHVARAHTQSHADGLFYCGWRGCARPHRGFNARYKMLVHVRTHTNERPHACPHCLKSFSRAENLKIHLRSHSGEKPYVCPFEGCGKAYSNSSDRFKHARTHTVDKPYCCKVPGCDKRYTDPSSLRKHVKTYKHFTPKATERDSSSEETTSAPGSPQKVPSPKRIDDFNNSILETVSLRVSPSCAVIAHNFNSASHEIDPAPVASPDNGFPPQITYFGPLVEGPRIPQYEMSYSEYTQMYERAYRIYYTSGVSVPPMRPRITCEEVYDSYKSPFQSDISVPYRSTHSPEYEHIDVGDEEMPLNLKCSSTESDQSAFEIPKYMDSPLDLSIRS